MIWHNSSANEVLLHLGSNADGGLTRAQTEQRQKEYGANHLTPPPKETAFNGVFCRQYIVIQWMAAAALLIVLAVRLYQRARGGTVVLWPYIAAAVLLLFGLLHRILRRRETYKLRRRLRDRAVLPVRVLREGTRQTIPADQLVPGDVIELQAEDLIPADARLLEAEGLFCLETPLTGEEKPVAKNAAAVLPPITPLTARAGMVYAGCAVTAGRARAVVTETGKNTQIRILRRAAALEEMPLTRRLWQLWAKYLAPASACAALLLFISGWIVGGEAWDPLVTAACFAAGCCGIEWSTLYHRAHAAAARRLAARQVILCSEQATEKLADVTALMVQKTGLLTSRKMSLPALVVGEKRFGSEDTGSQSVRLLLRLAVLCCTGRVEIGNGGQEITADPTESAILAEAVRRDMYPDLLLTEYPRLQQIPFTSQRCRMSSLHMIEGRYVLITKGTPEAVLPLCTAGVTPAVRQQEQALRQEGLRVIAVAYRFFEELPAVLSPADESGMTLVGLLGLRDTPQEKVLQTLGSCLHAGLTPVMCTGDHPQTAAEMAHRLGLAQKPEQVLDAGQLRAMSEEELLRRAPEIRVCSRIGPDGQQRVLRALQQSGSVVAVMGSGIEDLALLRQADVGCVSEENGCAPALDAADLILKQDRFDALVTALHVGKGVHKQVRRALYFATAAFLSVFLISLVGCFWPAGPQLPAWQWLLLAFVPLPLLAYAVACAPGQGGAGQRDQWFSLLCGGVPGVFAWLIALVWQVPFVLPLAVTVLWAAAARLLCIGKKPD
ncbi:MAG: cation-transporting P-type ATPase [Clostridia bacterium]|nr:cation-transporting P-type ATPase [Clostridia bacterium]